MFVTARAALPQNSVDGLKPCAGQVSARVPPQAGFLFVVGLRVRAPRGAAGCGPGYGKICGAGYGPNYIVVGRVRAQLSSLNSFFLKLAVSWGLPDSHLRVIPCIVCTAARVRLCVHICMRETRCRALLHACCMLACVCLTMLS